MDSNGSVRAPPSRLQPSAKVFAVCGLWLVALGLYFLFLRPVLLPEDSRYIGSSVETIRSTLPGLERWLSNVFNVLGGFIIATGALTVFTASRLRARREGGALTALLVSGSASVGLMSAINFILNSDFRWLLLLPALLWLGGLLMYLREGAASSTTRSTSVARIAAGREPRSGGPDRLQK